MIDQWFLADIKSHLKKHRLCVLIDTHGEAGFLLSCAKGDYTILNAHNDLEELHAKYIIEKSNGEQKPFLIYTTQLRDKLSFIRDYCEIEACVEISSMAHYVKQMLHDHLHLNIQLSAQDLPVAAKVSIGKDESYWRELCHKGASEIFDMQRELLPFLHDPDGCAKQYKDELLLKTFYQKIYELLGLVPMEKPAITLATELAHAMLDGLAKNTCTKILETVYERWLDSHSYSASFKTYLANYKLEENATAEAANENHPFRVLDERYLMQIGEAMLRQEAIATETLAKLNARHHSRQAQAVGVHFWGDVICLLEFDPRLINKLDSLGACIEFYQSHFYRLDTAIRQLYTEFLDKEALLVPLQERYKEYASIFLDKWFSFIGDYQQNQLACVQNIINAAHQKKIAIIVSDGVSYEIAAQIAERVPHSFKLSKNIILSDLPSETENNMSRIYMNNGTIEPIHSKREAYLLAQNKNGLISCINLDDVNGETHAAQVLICTHKDIDDLGEKMQLKALKYFSECVDFFAEKIDLLLRSGYEKVYLISDHGFVLTGLFSHADKISVSPEGEHKIAERYIRSKIEQPSLQTDFIERIKDNAALPYLYFAKSMNPFTSRGRYGFAHGGATPQELLTPHFCWESATQVEAKLHVTFANKEGLADVTGSIFTLKLQAESNGGNLFAQSRKVQIILFAEGVQISSSDMITINHDECIEREYSFEGHQELDIQLLDATSKQLIDKVRVKQNNSRDLGGLL